MSSSICITVDNYLSVSKSSDDIFLFDRDKKQGNDNFQILDKKNQLLEYEMIIYRKQYLPKAEVWYFSEILHILSVISSSIGSNVRLSTFSA